jgi:ubiquinone/menaquinone biosynthesis C-methylase UbiE
MAALCAEVTVFDNSKKQLEKDEFVAKRDGLTIRTVQGDMKDLSVFEDEYFDLIVHPWSNGYVDNVLPVWNECSRVLKKNGALIAGFGNPIECIFDLGEMEKGNLVVKHKIPYADTVDCFVFWTKDAAPLMDKLHILDDKGIKYYFQFTITPYGMDIEPEIRNKDKVLDTFVQLSKLIGKEKVVWRYDPILLSDKYSKEYHYRMFYRCEKR